MWRSLNLPRFDRTDLAVVAMLQRLGHRGGDTLERCLLLFGLRCEIATVAVDLRGSRQGNKN